jgi:hypothetical protein
MDEAKLKETRGGFNTIGTCLGRLGTWVVLIYLCSDPDASCLAEIKRGENTKYLINRKYDLELFFHEQMQSLH